MNPKNVTPTARFAMLYSFNQIRIHNSSKLHPQNMHPSFRSTQKLNFIRWSTLPLLRCGSGAKMFAHPASFAELVYSICNILLPDLGCMDLLPSRDTLHSARHFAGRPVFALSASHIPLGAALKLVVKHEPHPTQQAISYTHLSPNGRLINIPN